MSLSKTELRIQQLTDDRNKSIRSLSVLVAEGKDNSDAAKQLQQSIDDADRTVAALRKTIQAVQSVQSVQEQEQRQRTNDHVAAQTASAVTASVANVITNRAASEKRAAQESQLRSYLKNGKISEVRDLLISTDNGALLPQDFGVITEALKYSGTIAADVYNYDNATGRPVKFSVSDDTARGLVLVVEGGATSSLEADPTAFSTVPAGVDTLIGRVDYSKQFAEDVAVATYLQRLIGPSVARTLSKAVMVGTDYAGTALTASPTGGYLSGIPIGEQTASVSAGIGIGDCDAIFNSVDAEYQETGSWYMHSKTRAYLLNLKDSAGRSLFGASPQDGLKTIFGRPVKLDQNLAAPTAGAFAANSLPIIFGRHDIAYGVAISDVAVKVLVERFSDVMINSLLFYTKVQGARLVSAASSALKIAAA